MSRQGLEGEAPRPQEAIHGAARTALRVRPVVTHGQFGLGKLYRGTGKLEHTLEHLTTTTAMYRDMGITYWLEKAEAEVTKPGLARKSRVR